MQILSLSAIIYMALFVSPTMTAKKNIFCYFGSWSIYRPGSGAFNIEDIDGSLCTHLIYTFIGVQLNNVKILDEWADLPSGKDGFNKFNKLRIKYPELKTLVAIGGWNEGSRKFSKMAETPENREEFAQNVISFVKKYKFNGLDLDWEYPAQRSGAKSDVQNYIELLKVIKKYFDEVDLILSAAVAATEYSASKSYIIPEISKYLDFINVMTYDFHVGDEERLDINAPLYPGLNESEFYKGWNVKESVNYWLSQGCPKEKLLMGVPLYGRTFTLCDPKKDQIGADSCGRGDGGPYTRELGVMGYNEICEQFQNDSGWNLYYNEERQGPFASKKTQWISYDNDRSIKKKAEFINEMDLGGAMVWSIETDDFNGNCGEKNILLKTLNSVIRNE